MENQEIIDIFEDFNEEDITAFKKWAARRTKKDPMKGMIECFHVRACTTYNVNEITVTKCYAKPTYNDEYFRLYTANKDIFGLVSHLTTEKEIDDLLTDKEDGDTSIYSSFAIKKEEFTKTVITKIAKLYKKFKISLIYGKIEGTQKYLHAYSSALKNAKKLSISVSAKQILEDVKKIEVAEKEEAAQLKDTVEKLKDED